jgi:hypothetical protein
MSGLLAQIAPAGGDVATAWAVAVGLGLVLVGIVVLLAKVSDRWRRRRRERAVLRGTVTDALMGDAVLSGLTVVPRVRVPFWSGTPATVILSGDTRTGEERMRARTIARHAAHSVRPDVAIKDRMTIAPAGRRAA